MGEIERNVNGSDVRKRINEFKEEEAQGTNPKELEELKSKIKEDIFAMMSVTPLSNKVDHLMMQSSSSKPYVEIDSSNENGVGPGFNHTNLYKNHSLLITNKIYNHCMYCLIYVFFDTKLKENYFYLY